jgi:hypothetical protein
MAGPWEDFQSEGPWADYAPTSAPVEAPVTAGGAYSALDTGLQKGVAGIAALPRAIGTLGAQGIQGAANYIGGKLGLPQDTRDLTKSGLIDLPTSERALTAIQKDFGGKNYEPQNRLERGLQTLGEFAPNALFPGGAVSRVAGVALPALATDVTREAGGGDLAQAGAALVGGAGATKLANVAERLSTKALPSIEKGVAGGLPDVTKAQYGQVTKEALATPQTPIQRGAVADLIQNDLHAQNFRQANAPETLGVLNDIRSGTPGKTSDVADLLAARRKLGNISGEDGVAAGKAREAIDQILEIKVPGIGKQLETADKNYNALKVAEMLSSKLTKADLQSASTHSGLNLGNKLRQAAEQIVTNPNRTRFMNPEDIAALTAISKGTMTQNAIRYVSKFLGGGGGLGAVIAASTFGGHLGGPEGGLEGGLGTALTGLALTRGYNRSIARAAAGVGKQVLARSPQAGVLGASYTAPKTLAGSLGTGGVYALPTYQGILGR